mgnify:FL=1
MVSLRIGVLDQHAEPDGSLGCLNQAHGRQMLGRLGQHAGVAEKQLALLEQIWCWSNIVIINAMKSLHDYTLSLHDYTPTISVC